MVCIGKRYLISLLSCLGFAFIMLLQILTQAWTHIEHQSINNSTTISGIINVVFFIGRMTSLVGGIIGNRYAGAIVFGIAMLLSAGISLLLELLLRINLVLLVLTIFFQGAIQGLIYSSMADVWSRWTSLQHRSKYISFTLAGCQLAEMIEVTFFSEGNNPLEFVASGAAICGIVWLLLVKNDPSQDENLSSTEKIILQERLKFLDEKSVALSQYPWIPILKSKSFWALNVAAFVKVHLYGKISQPFETITFISSILIFIFNMIMGCIVDCIRNKNIITKNKMKLLACVSFIAQGMTLIACYSSFSDPAVMFVLFVLGLIFSTSAEVSLNKIRPFFVYHLLSYLSQLFIS